MYDTMGEKQRNRRPNDSIDSLACDETDQTVSGHSKAKRLQEALLHKDHKPLEQVAQETHMLSQILRILEEKYP